MPSSFAFWFISFTNLSVFPATPCATATAASFPEQSIKPYSSVSSDSFSPSFRYMEDPSVLAASAETFTMPFRLPFSSATSAVMIFVVLAISIFAFSFWAYSTRPESTSISTADVAEVLTADT